MESRLYWILAIITLWIVVRTWVRRLQSRSAVHQARRRRTSKRRTRPRLRHRALLGQKRKVPSPVPRVEKPPHSFARFGQKPGEFLDLSQDTKIDLLQSAGLPVLHTPDDLANWLQVPVNRLAWLSHRLTKNVPPGIDQTHYVYQWKTKRLGGLRLIESPKAQLKAVQRQILHGMLDKLWTSPAAHGFVMGRSIVTNAQPHLGASVVLKFDLQDFYLRIRGRRVTRLYRRLGYSREVALWLTRLTTSVIPGNLPIPPGDLYALWRYRGRHLPQGAPTSPALANLLAAGLDQRLKGLAASFGATYTRYADDLTFSGPDKFSKALRVFIPLVEQTIRQSGFRANARKRQVLRPHQRQLVTGVVVNEKLNVCRKDFDNLKAVLHRCCLHGPAQENRDQHADFAAHLRGRIAHVAQLNPSRGQKLWDIFEQINW